MKIQLSLVSKIVSICVFTLALSTVVGVYQFASVTDQLKRNKNQEIITHAKVLSAAIAAQFYERYGDVQAFTKNQVFLSGSAKQMQEALNDYGALYNIYDLILYVDKQGHLISVNSKSPQGKEIDTSQLYEKNYTNEDWFKKVSQGIYDEDKAKGFEGTSFGDVSVNPLLKEVYGKPVLATTFSAPVKKANGEIVGYMCNIANFMWVEDEFINLQNELNLLAIKDFKLSLVNKNGLLITQFPKNQNSNTANPKFGYDLLKQGDPAVTSALKGETGVVVLPKTQDQDDLVTSYTSIHSKKFIDSINWVVKVQIPQNQVLAGSQNSMNNFYATSFVVFLITTCAAYFLSRKLGQQFANLGDKLANAVAATEEISKKISENSDIVSNTSTQNSSAIQESVASLSEMESMLSMTAQNVLSTKKTASQVMSQVDEGKKIMQRLSQSMEQMSKANTQIQGMSQLIDSISTKTSVINDIVFKTQLLSFNASIEASRAGQHGRGFSVVAEEVGKLAELSGQAAEEIENLLVSSRRQMQETLGLIQDRIKEGSSVSHIAFDVFNQVAQQIDDINEQVASINEATEQQEVGIRETNLAVKQMDELGRSNSAAATESQRMSAIASTQSQNLNQVLTDLKHLVQG